MHWKVARDDIYRIPTPKNKFYRVKKLTQSPCTDFFGSHNLIGDTLRLNTIW